MKLWLKLIQTVLIILMLLSLASTAAASETVQQAREISGQSLLRQNSGIRQANYLFDKGRSDFAHIRSGAAMTLSSEEGIGSLYILFGRTCGEYTVTDTDSGKTHVWGENGFLHEFLDLEAAFGEAPRNVTLSFSGEGDISEIYAFTSGQVPDFVQKWELPANGETDLVLFSTHGDDEQLFFAGLLPYYAVERGYQVQVVYFTDHRNSTLRRVGEMLNGLWAVGIRNHPVIGTFGDFHSESLEEARKIYRMKQESEQDQLAFVVENIRRFRPKVAVGHDLNGEYGHGMHMLYAELLCQAVNIAMDREQFPESAEKYGVWDVPKTYLHLYHKNEIVMEWDQPMENFDGMTPYQVTKYLGFPCHVSQQPFYSWYMSGAERASEIREYSPCRYGLYRTTVGEDTKKNDMFENLSSYAQDIRLEQEFLAQEEEPAESAEVLPEETESALAATEPRQAETEQVNIPDFSEENSENRVIWIALGASAAILMICAVITKIMYPDSGKKK